MSEYTSPRSFAEFLAPALVGVAAEDTARIGLALDVAIAFGALEHAAGNPSLRDPDELALAYAEKLARLKRLALESAHKGPPLPPALAALEAELEELLGADAFDEAKRTVTRHFDQLVQSLLSIAPRAPTVN